MPRRSISSVGQSPSGSASTPSPASASNGRRVSARRQDNALMSLQAEAQVERHNEVLEKVIDSCRNDHEIADQCFVICQRRQRKACAEEAARVTEEGRAEDRQAALLGRRSTDGGLVVRGTPQSGLVLARRPAGGRPGRVSGLRRRGRYGPDACGTGQARGFRGTATRCSASPPSQTSWTT